MKRWIIVAIAVMVIAGLALPVMAAPPPKSDVQDLLNELHELYQQYIVYVAGEVNQGGVSIALSTPELAQLKAQISSRLGQLQGKLNSLKSGVDAP